MIDPHEDAVGLSFLSKETINIKDAKNDDRINIKKNKLKVKIKSMLVCPILFNGEDFAVIQAINKFDEENFFNKVDEIIIENFTEQCGYFIKNSTLYSKSLKAENKSLVLSNIIDNLIYDEENTINNVSKNLINYAIKLVNCDKCSIF